MPVVFTNPQFPNQVGASPTTQSFSTECNFGQLLREVTDVNPNLDPMKAARLVNMRYRQMLDRRSWYGLKIRGIAVVPDITDTGSCSTTFGSLTVQGIGTAWTPTLVGLQFRQSFTYPYQTITAVNQTTQQLTLDTPFPGNTFVGGYQIVAAWITFGANVKRILWATNQQQGWSINVRTPVESLNVWDTWRQSLGWTRHFATRAPTPDGQFQVEVWPTPYAQQAFPFELYGQPPEMVADGDAPVAWIRTDCISSGCMADALRYRPKANPYYSEQAAISIATTQEQIYEKKLAEMEEADNDLDQQDVTWDYGWESGDVNFGDGSAWAQAHDI